MFKQYLLSCLIANLTVVLLLVMISAIFNTHSQLAEIVMYEFTGAIIGIITVSGILYLIIALFKKGNHRQQNPQLK